MPLPPLTPLQRRAAFKAAVTLNETSAAKVARAIGVSYNHLMLVLNDQRHGSDRLRRALAAFLERPEEEVFGRSSTPRPRGGAREVRRHPTAHQLADSQSAMPLTTGWPEHVSIWL